MTLYETLMAQLVRDGVICWTADRPYEITDAESYKTTTLSDAEQAAMRALFERHGLA